MKRKLAFLGAILLAAVLFTYEGNTYRTYDVRIVNIVGEHPGKTVFISGVAVRAVKYVVGLSGDAHDSCHLVSFS